MATQMLRYGFFHQVRLDREEGVCVKLRNDSILSNNIADTDDATYIFVSKEHHFYIAISRLIGIIYVFRPLS